MVSSSVRFEDAKSILIHLESKKAKLESGFTSPRSLDKYIACNNFINSANSEAERNDRILLNQIVNVFKHLHLGKGDEKIVQLLIDEIRFANLPNS